MYGKTSDRDLYGAQLPSSSYSDPAKQRGQASEKTERFIANDAISEFDSYGFGDRYANLLAKQLEETTKPTKALNFISYADFKPISQYTDPDTYNYLKNLEQYTKEQNIKFPKGIGGFKPFVSYVEGDPEEEQAYKSIQDILDAHEANKGTKNVKDDDERANYNTNNYGSGKSRKKANPRKKPGDSKPRCYSGRCRKRATSSVRIRTRPYIRKVTQNRWHKGYWAYEFSNLKLTIQ